MPADSVRHIRQHKERGSFTKFEPMKDIIFGVIRHILTAGGGTLTGGGLAGQDEVNTGVGAAMFLLGLGWSIVEKVRAKKAAA